MQKASEQLVTKYLQTARTHEGFVVVFDLKTPAGEPGETQTTTIRNFP